MQKEKRTERYYIRVEPSFKKMIEKMAAKKHMSVSEYLRLSVIEQIASDKLEQKAASK